MAQTLTIPQIDVQSNKLTITDEQVLIDGESHGITPLADVDAETSADTILGVKDGAVVQLDPDELKDELGITDVESDITAMGQIYTTSWTENGMNFYAVRVGRVAQIHCNSGTATSDVSANGTVTTVPVGFRPYGVDVNLWDTARASRLVVGTSGVMITTTAIAAGIQPRFFVSYICQDTLPS